MGGKVSKKTEKKTAIARIVGAVSVVLAFLGFSGLEKVGAWLYNGWLVQPNIECQINGDEMDFFVEEEYRSVSLVLHPQMVVQFDDYIILLVYLKEYYEEEHLYFDREKKCKAIVSYPHYADLLQGYMLEEITQCVCLMGENISEEDIDKRLKVYVSTLGGVRYQSEEGNEEKRFCVIENGGIVMDMDENSEEVKERLYEAELTMKDSTVGMEAEEDINMMAQGVAEEIVKLYSDTRSE